MAQPIQLSEHELSEVWLDQFQTSKDRALAKQLINQLKLVSGRDFETGIEDALCNLQHRLRQTIGVYPISSPLAEGISGYNIFTGGIPADDDTKSRESGRRRKFGREDRVGHILAKLQDRFKRSNGASIIECLPTLNQLRTQGIKHIVLVDDISGSGKRITDYWNNIPRRIKSLLSLKKVELWIVLYAITPKGKTAITKAMPNFPISNLITVLPEVTLKELISDESLELCRKYASLIGLESSAIGYRGSACPIIFEHGCPNNLPAILWDNNRRNWQALFPNRSIPSLLRSSFDRNNSIQRHTEALWNTNQPKLALRILDCLNEDKPLPLKYRVIFTILGLRKRRMSERKISSKLILSISEFSKYLNEAQSIGLYDKATSSVTPLGQEFLSRFRNRINQKKHNCVIVNNDEMYYPLQCEGKIR